MVSDKNAIKKIGYIIKFYRRLKGLSQFEMAEQIQISTRNFQRLENGEVEPKLETLQKIARVFGMPIAALIRPTDENILLVDDLSSHRERNNLNEVSAEVKQAGTDLQFAEKIILQDSYQGLPNDFEVMASLDGPMMTITQKLADISGLCPRSKSNLDDYSLDGSSVERWEFIARARIKTALIRNFYMFPSGFRAIESYHPNIDANPDSPRSECFVRDITARYELEQWLSQIRKIAV